MQRNKIVSQLKAYQNSEKNPHLLDELTESFLAGINPRILENNRLCAECAVRKVLKAMFAVPLHPLLCLEAMLQFCRDDTLDFAVWQDTDLISRINTNFYFSQMMPEDMIVETQEGVV